MSNTNDNLAPTTAQRVEKIDGKTDQLMSLLDQPAGISKIDLALQALGELLQGQQALHETLEALRAKVLAGH